MKTQLHYDAIGVGLTVRIGLENLSARDKVELFRTLMDDLGITAQFHHEPDATARAQEIIVERWSANWGA